jgi:2-polyprenyl-3-methyl-5-hydroxy-6-metoxy-1,4-benzoquinol methylase
MAQTRPNRCWLCDGEAAHEWKPRNLPGRLTPADLKITDSHYGRTLRLLGCSRCGFIFADGEELAELEALYSALDDDGYVESSDARRLQMRWMLERVREHLPVRSLLDVGCATGLLLEEAQALGIHATGIEPSFALVQQARAKGMRAIHGVLPHAELSEWQYDLVALMDVIEHVSDPLALLRAGAARTRPGGALLVVTPDVSSAMAKLLGHRWWHLRAAHVCYFDERTMRAATSAAGLSVQAQFRPRWFFPVSYLMARVQQYVPLPLPTLKQSWMGRAVIPLQLGDSWAFLLRKPV